MRRLFVLFLPLIILGLSVPWPFIERSDDRLFGMPFWVVYSIANAFAFAIIIAVLIGLCWEVSAGSEDDENSR